MLSLMRVGGNHPGAVAMASCQPLLQRSIPPMRAPLLALTLLLACAATQAQTAPRKPKPNPEPRTATLGGAAPAGSDRVMSRDELRACLQRQQAQEPRRAELARQQATLDAERADLLQSGQALQAELAALDRSSPDAVAAYNARATDRDSKVDTWNQRNARFSDDARASQAEQQAWQADCAGRRFREDDETALRKAR
jgi:hypothetical protein